MSIIEEIIALGILVFLVIFHSTFIPIFNLYIYINEKNKEQNQESVQLGRTSISQSNKIDINQPNTNTNIHDKQNTTTPIPSTPQISEITNATSIKPISESSPAIYLEKCTTNTNNNKVSLNMMIQTPNQKEINLMSPKHANIISNKNNNNNKNPYIPELTKGRKREGSITINANSRRSSNGSINLTYTMGKYFADEQRRPLKSFFCPTFVQFKKSKQPKNIRWSRLFYQYSTIIFMILCIFEIILVNFEHLFKNINHKIPCDIVIGGLFFDHLLVRSLFNMILVMRLYVIFYGSVYQYSWKLPVFVFIIEICIFIGYVILYIWYNFSKNNISEYDACDIENSIPKFTPKQLSIYDIILALICAYLFIKPMSQLMNKVKTSKNVSDKFIHMCIKYCLLTIIMDIFTLISEILLLTDVIPFFRADLFVGITDSIGLLLMFKDYNSLYNLMFCCCHKPILLIHQKIKNSNTKSLSV